ncbi:MAG: alcohol dehydrogenase catalytic domain-containing protein [Leucobacter sp.]
MRAAVFYGKEDLRVEEVAEPSEIGSGQIKVRVGYAGICGSELHIYYYPELVPQISETAHPLTGAKLPQILGHEISGTVVEVGEGVEGVAIGDRGAVFPTVASCGECSACRNGVPMSCRLMASLGANAPGGGFSEYIVISADKFHRLPDGVDLRMGALVEPMAVGWHAVARSGVQEGSTALLVGAGPVGIGAWYGFRARGVEKVLVSEPNADRRAAIAALGATVIDPIEEDLAAAVAELTGGEGVAVAVDAAGVQPAFTSALESLAPTGRLSLVAMHEVPVQFDGAGVMLGEKEIVGSVGYDPKDFDEIIAAMDRGVYNADGWVADRELDEVVDVIRELHDGIGSKVLIRIG